MVYLMLQVTSMNSYKLKNVPLALECLLFTSEDKNLTCFLEYLLSVGGIVNNVTCVNRRTFYLA